MSIAPVDFRRATRAVANWQRVLLLTHERPDGDALGSLAALADLLQAQGKQPVAMIFGEVPPRYAPLMQGALLQPWSPLSAAEAAESYDGLILTDTAARNQLLPAAAVIDGATLPLVVVDHHVTRDLQGDCQLIDAQASSASLIVAEWAAEADWPLSARAASWLFIGMATDTGWFRFSSTDARTLALAARLLSAGLHPDRIYQTLYLSDSPARLRLIASMLGGVTLHAGGRLAVSRVTVEMMAAAGATSHDLEDLVNETQRLGQVDSSVFLVERSDGPVKVSLRSKGLVDVAEVARRFGGGGHRRAAGARIAGSLAAIEERVVEVMLDELQAALRAPPEQGHAQGD
jgi:phosphoesterase RecJ-like protein